MEKERKKDEAPKESSKSKSHSSQHCGCPEGITSNLSREQVHIDLVDQSYVLIT